MVLSDIVCLLFYKQIEASDLFCSLVTILTPFVLPCHKFYTSVGLSGTLFLCFLISVRIYENIWPRSFQWNWNHLNCGHHEQNRDFRSDKTIWSVNIMRRLNSYIWAQFKIHWRWMDCFINHYVSHLICIRWLFTASCDPFISFFIKS